MAKKTNTKKKAVRMEMTAEDHRKLGRMHSAKSSLHHAKAELLDVQNPQKKSTGPRPY